MTDDLVKRLRDYINCRPWVEGRTFDATHPEVLIAQSADRIEQLEERNKQLEAALRFYKENCSSELKIETVIMGAGGDYGKIAHAALGEKNGEDAEN